MKLYSTVCVGLLVVFICQAPKVQVTDSFCQTARIIVASSHDTPQTLAAVRTHNATVRKLCNK